MTNVRLGNFDQFDLSPVPSFYDFYWPDLIRTHMPRPRYFVCVGKTPNSIKYIRLFVSNANYCICISKRRKCDRYQSRSYQSWWSVGYLGLRWDTPTRLRSAWQPWPWWLLVMFQFTITGGFTCSAEFHLVDWRLDSVMVVGTVDWSVPSGEVLHILLLLLLLCPSVALYTLHGTVHGTVHTDRRIGAQLWRIHINNY